MEGEVLGEVVKALASWGIPGLLLGLVATLYHLKDKTLQEEMRARIEDAKKFNELAMALQKDVITAVSKLSDIVEIWEKREEERERDERAARAVSSRGGRLP